MKIAMISEHASPLAILGGADAGGQNIYVAHVARQLARGGCRVDIFTRREAPDTPEIVEFDDGVRVVHVRAGPARILPKEKLLPYMDEFGDTLAGFLMSEAQRGRPYDLLHANFFMSGAAALVARARSPMPLVMTFHALGKVRRLHQGSADGFPDARFGIETRLVREADRIIAECPQDRDDLVDLYGGDPDRIDIVPCGFDDREFYPIEKEFARARLRWDPAAFSILQLGRLVPRKGIDNVIRAVAVLRKRHAQDALLYVVGGNSDQPDEEATPEIGRLREVARAAGVADRVRFCGRRGRDALHLHYGAADVFVTTPWYEPFGITPVEAMACARPVIGARVGGIKSTVVDGETGFLVPPKDPDALAARLAELAADSGSARRLGQAGRDRALAHFTWASVARAVRATYDRALHEFPVQPAMRLLSSSISPSITPSIILTSQSASNDSSSPVAEVIPLPTQQPLRNASGSSR